MLYCFGQSFGTLQSKNEFSVRHMRLTASHFRGAQSANGSWVSPPSLSSLDSRSHISSAGVQSLGLVYDGCTLEIEQQQFDQDSSHYVTFGREVSANGFSFRTLAQADTQYLDALAFTVSVCDTISNSSLTSPLDCPSWRVVGSSRCLWTIYSSRCINVQNAQGLEGNYPTSRQRDFQHILSLTPSWFQVQCLLARYLYVTVGSWGAVALALMGYHHAARRFVGLVACVLNGAINSIGLAFYLLHDVHTPNFLSSVYPAGCGLFIGLFLGSIFLFGEEYLIKYYTIPIAGVGMLMCFLLDALVVFRGTEYFTWIHLVQGWWGDPILIVSFWFLIAASRVYISRGARQEIQQDINLYQHVWKLVLDIENAEQAEISRVLIERESATIDNYSQHTHTTTQTHTQLQLLSNTARKILDIISRQRLIAKHTVARRVCSGYTFGEQRKNGNGAQGLDEHISDPFGFKIPDLSDSSSRSSCRGVGGQSDINSRVWCRCTSMSTACSSFFSLHQVCVEGARERSVRVCTRHVKGFCPLRPGNLAPCPCV